MHFIASLASRNHITATEVANTYRLMTEAVEATFQLEGMKCARRLDDLTKTMILAMQGGWLTRHAYNWKCVDSTRSCDVPPKYGRIFKERILDHDTGLTRYMIRNETIASKTMYLLGLHALNTEHLLVAKAIDLTFRMGCTVHGCVVDGVMVKGSPEQLEELRAAALQNTRPDGTCYFRIKRTAAGRDIFHTAPKNPVEARTVVPCTSTHRHHQFTCHPSLKSMFKGTAYGAWLTEPRFLYPRVWDEMTEEGGVGSCDVHDTYQRECAKAIFKKGSALVIGAGGSGIKN